MSCFVALADSRLLAKACAELSAQFEFTKRRYGLWVPDEILGVWVGSHPSLNLRFRSSFGFPSRWMMVCFDEPSLTRAVLLDMLVSRGIQQSRVVEPRFIPVFSRATPEDRRNAELAQMRALHPDETRDSLLMNPMTGALSVPVEGGGEVTKSP